MSARILLGITRQELPLWLGSVLPGTLMPTMNDTDQLARCPSLLRRWTRHWRVSEIATRIIYERSTRLRRSLGHAYPQRYLIRLSQLLTEPEYSSLFDEVLCHEAAHIANYHLHGQQVTNHGPEWRDLVSSAGFEPRLHYKTDLQKQSRIEDSVRYDHICPICQTRRTAKRPHTQWRCLTCQSAGLDGTLSVHSRPTTTEGPRHA